MVLGGSVDALVCMQESAVEAGKRKYVGGAGGATVRALVWNREEEKKPEGEEEGVGESERGDMVREEEARMEVDEIGMGGRDSRDSRDSRDIRPSEIVRNNRNSDARGIANQNTNQPVVRNNTNPYSNTSAGGKISNPYSNASETATTTTPSTTPTTTTSTTRASQRDLPLAPPQAPKPPQQTIPPPAANDEDGKKTRAQFPPFSSPDEGKLATLNDLQRIISKGDYDHEEVYRVKAVLEGCLGMNFPKVKKVKKECKGLFEVSRSINAMRSGTQGSGSSAGGTKVRMVGVCSGYGHIPMLKLFFDVRLALRRHAL